MNCTIHRSFRVQLYKTFNLAQISSLHQRAHTLHQPVQQPPNQTKMSTNPLSTTSRVVIKTLAFARIAVGGGTLFAPSAVCELFGASINPGSHIIARLFGIRDMMFGAYLLNSCWNFESSSSSSDVAPDQKPLNGAAVTNNDEQYWLKRELRRAVYLGMICDAVDVCSSAVGIMDGTLAGKGVWLIGGGALEFLIMGLFSLNRLK